MHTKDNRVNLNNFYTKGFTLAEVLLTLAITGVIAALTIPNLLVNHEKQATVEKLKKSYGTLYQAVEKAKFENGPIKDWGFTGESTFAGMTTIYEKMFAPNLNVARYCGPSHDNSPCWPKGYKISGEVYDNWNIANDYPW